MSSSASGPRKPFTAERQMRKRLGLEPSPSALLPLDLGDLLAEMGHMREEMRTLSHFVRSHLAPEEPVAEEEVEEDPILREYERQRSEVNILRIELKALANSIEETKREIAQLRSGDQDSDKLTAVAHELDAVVGATERATNGILEGAERIDALAIEIKAHAKDSFLERLADDIVETVLGMYEHCNFQDITGQRITKVVNTLKFVESRVDKMIEIWGHEAFERALGEDTPARGGEEEGRLLNGPQLQDHGISQDEIDRLFD